MTFSWFLSMLGFIWITAITPGPNNLLLTTSGANFGFFRSLVVIVGIVIGMQTVVWLSIAGIGGLILTFPIIHNTLKLLGSLYMLWIAWKIATSDYQQCQTDTVDNQPVSWYQAGLLQLLNPKAWLMGLGAVATYNLPAPYYLSSSLLISLVIFIVNIIAGLIWLTFGSIIGHLLCRKKTWCIFNGLMGLLTALCALLIWL